MKARNAFRLPAKGLSEKNCAIPTWRTHSCVPRRHSCRRPARANTCREESRHCTHECVRHVDRQVARLGPARGAACQGLQSRRVRTPDAAEFGLSQVACVRGRIDDRFLSSVERRAPAQARQSTETDRLSYQACAADSPSGGSAHFPQRAENTGQHQEFGESSRLLLPPRAALFNRAAAGPTLPLQRGRSARPPGAKRQAPAQLLRTAPRRLPWCAWSA